MREIDLIPADHVRARAARRSLAMFAAVLSLVLLAAAGGRGWLAWRLSSERAAAADSRRQAGAAEAQRARLARLTASVDAGRSRIAALHRLLDGSPGDGWWQAVDAAWNDRIWLDAVAYSRRPVDAAAAATAGASAAPPAAPATAAVATVLEHQLELRGHALDHAAVAEFRRALAEQPGVTGLRLGDTALQAHAGRDVVAFVLTATLASSPEGEPDGRPQPERVP